MGFLQDTEILLKKKKKFLSFVAFFLFSFSIPKFHENSFEWRWELIERITVRDRVHSQLQQKRMKGWSTEIRAGVLLLPLLRPLLLFQTIFSSKYFQAPLFSFSSSHSCVFRSLKRRTRTMRFRMKAFCGASFVTLLPQESLALGKRFLSHSILFFYFIFSPFVKACLQSGNSFS